MEKFLDLWEYFHKISAFYFSGMIASYFYKLESFLIMYIFFIHSPWLMMHWFLHVYLWALYIFLCLHASIIWYR